MAEWGKIMVNISYLKGGCEFKKNRLRNYGIIKNVFNTSYRKKCLLEYIIYPFESKNNKITHVNFYITKIFAEFFHNKKMQVDVIDWNQRVHWPYIQFKDYDMILSVGGVNVKEALEKKNENCKLIIYTTMASASYNNAAERMRIEELKLRRPNYSDNGLKREFRNIDYALSMADLILCCGNNWTASTMGKFRNKIYCLPGTGLNMHNIDLLNREYKEVKSKFLWFGSNGLVHKGLDLCLEAFGNLGKNYPDIELYIGGPREKELFRIYRKELEGANIHYMGFLDVKSEKFLRICKKCSYIIFPSCAEGQATSVITAMYSGLIPIVTEQCGIDIGEFGIQIKSISIEDLENLIIELANFSEEELKKRSQLTYEYVINNQSINNFKMKLEEILKPILKDF